MDYGCDSMPLYLWKLWAVKCNEQAERQLRKAKPQYGKRSIVRGREAELKSMGIVGTGFDSDALRSANKWNECVGMEWRKGSYD